MAQLVVVDTIFVPERDAEDALADRGGGGVLDPLRQPGVAAAGGEAADQVDGALRRTEQYRSGVRHDRAAVEVSANAGRR